MSILPKDELKPGDRVRILRCYDLRVDGLGVVVRKHPSKKGYFYIEIDEIKSRFPENLACFPRERLVKL